MKKIIVLFFLIIFVLSSAYSATQYFMEQLSACFSVDLASKKYYGHSARASWAGKAATDTKEPTKYYDSQIICVVGVEGSSQKTYVSFNFNSILDWYYILNGNDTRYRRPFGIDLVIRSNDITITDIIHLGRQSENSRNDKNITIELPIADGKTIDEKYNQKFNSVWVDVILVMDPFVNSESGLINDGNHDIEDTNAKCYGYLVPSDDIYSSSFNVNIGPNADGSGGNSYSLLFNGYYSGSPNANPTDKFTSSLFVTPNSNATSFDIKVLKESDLTTEIGSYFFTTNSLRDGNQNKYKNSTAYFFVSASSSGYNKSDDGFLLKYVSPISNTMVVNTNKYNSVSYEIGIQSQSSTTPIWFTGKDYFDSKNSNELISKSVKANTIIEKGSNSKQYVFRVSDEGQILLKITGNVDDLSAGRYRSNVYFHVVTDY